MTVTKNGKIKDINSAIKFRDIRMRSKQKTKEFLDISIKWAASISRRKSFIVKKKKEGPYSKEEGRVE